MADATINARDFDAEHRNDGVVINGWLHFSDGAYREINPLGKRCVPTDPYRKAKLIALYWQARLDLAVEEFTVFKQKLLTRTNACRNRQVCLPPPGPDAIERLESLKAKVEDFQAKLQEAEKNVGKNKPTELIQRELADAELREECEDVLLKIRGFQI